MPTFIFSHQGFKVLTDIWHDKSREVFGGGGGGGNQDVSCNNVDSAYFNEQIFQVKDFSQTYLFSGKDLNNRFYTKNPPYVRTLGRSGGRDTKDSIPRGAVL